VSQPDEPSPYDVEAGPRAHPARRWLAWAAGAAGLGAVVAVALHFSEGQEFLRIAERAQPWWLLVAVALQAATYLADAQVWRGVTRAAGFSLPLGAVYRLSLAKLFVDQALPSGGISGTVVMARALEQRGTKRPAVMAAVVIDSASYYLTYVVCLAAALIITLVHHQASPLVLISAAAFASFALALTVVILVLAGRGSGASKAKVRRLRVLRRALELLERADPRLTRNPRLIAQASVYQLTVFVLDASTVWVLIEALGASASPLGVFASFMISTLFRTLGVLPGGLGTFEATSVLTLKMIGVDLAVALSATLLFRGLSFWLPMLPGLWFSRAAVHGRQPARTGTFGRSRAGVDENSGDRADRAPMGAGGEREGSQDRR
jgi:uncharacterized protein (TIRG00374 family)